MVDAEADPAHASIESGAFDQPPPRQLKIPLTPTKVVSDDELESIHNASPESLARGLALTFCMMVPGKS